MVRFTDFSIDCSNGLKWSWTFDVVKKDPQNTGREESKFDSCKDFYCYRLMKRENESSHLLWSSHLLLQYLTDVWAKSESEQQQSNFLRHNQKTLRAESYQNLWDHMLSDGDPAAIGRATILPASHAGSDRYMHQRGQDALWYCQLCGNLTFSWLSQLTQNGLKYKENCDQVKQRQDIIARVFHLKVKKIKSLLREPKQGQVFIRY